MINAQITDLSQVVLSQPVPSREMDKHEFAAKRHAAEMRAANVLASLGLGLGPGSITVRGTLPFNDLALDGLGLGAGGADSRDQWVLPATVQGTNLAWINVNVPQNRVCVVYGAWYNAATPLVAVLRLEKGGGVMYEHQLELVDADLESVLYFPMLATWRPQETLIARVIPRQTTALGQHFGLLSVVAEPKGQRANGDMGGAGSS